MSFSLVRRHVLLLLSGLVLAASAQAPDSAHAQAGKPEGLYYKSWAVVIGIEQYLVAPPVPGASASAKAAATALRGLGFDEVIEVHDKEAGSRRLLNILNDYLPRKVGRQDRVVLYFAGHAAVAPDGQGKDLGYILPWDAQTTNTGKTISFDFLKEFTRRSAAKHILLLFDANVQGWEVSTAQPLSLEGRGAPEDDTEKRAIQVLTAGGKDDKAEPKSGESPFVTAFVGGLHGAADRDQNGWIMASEMAAYVTREVEAATGGAQHPHFLQLEGDGDVILIEGQKGRFSRSDGPLREADRVRAARVEYEQAFELLQQQKAPDEVLERLNRAIAYDPSFGDAYVLKSYVRLEILPELTEALAAAKAAVQYAPQNPDSHFTLGLVLEKQGQYRDAERAMRQAVAVNPAYADVYYSLGVLYADRLQEPQQSLDAYRRYVELGGQSRRAIQAVQSAAGQAQP